MQVARIPDGIGSRRPAHSHCFIFLKACNTPCGGWAGARRACGGPGCRSPACQLATAAGQPGFARASPARGADGRKPRDGIRLPGLESRGAWPLGPESPCRATSRSPFRKQSPGCRPSGGARAARRGCLTTPRCVCVVEGGVCARSATELWDAGGVGACLRVQTFVGYIDDAGPCNAIRWVPER